MEKLGYGYHGRASALAEYQMKLARAVSKAQAERGSVENKPIYFVKLSDVSEVVFDQVLDIYESVYNKSGRFLVRPQIEELSKELALSGSGYIDWDLMGHHSVLLEARRRIGPEGEIFVRFRTMPGGSTSIEEARNDKRDDFQNRVDSLFIGNQMAVKLKDTF